MIFFDVPNFIPPGKSAYRIVSMDGGGIYGLATALLLKKTIDDKNSPQDFLARQTVHLFSGTSAGAINALLLAKEEDPRAFVIGGGLDEFWRQSGTFANEKNPIDAFWSWFGLTAWLGTLDFQELLRQTFGDMTFRELKNNVLVATFDWSGVDGRHWRPRFFSNGHEADLNRRVADVAYGAASPPGLRALVDGLGDAGIFAPDPCTNAVAAVINYLGKDDPGQYLKHVFALSVGVATRQPFYWLKQFNLGMLPFYFWLPTNPFTGDYYPPGVQSVLNGPTDDTVWECKNLLGERYHRLSPRVIGPPNLPPTLIATSWARFPWWQQYLIGEITKTLDSTTAMDSVVDTAKYLKNQWN
ncbi:MAG: patatin-like phospholipase family protein [Acidobacteriota bacterium]|nr:patatin-like phospholipase family protein [Acidobacteriota bacterium]